MILLKRLLLEPDIWVLHMPTFSHQSAGEGGGGQKKLKFCIASAGMGGLCSIANALQLQAAGSLGVCAAVRGQGQSNTSPLTRSKRLSRCILQI